MSNTSFNFLSNSYLTKNDKETFSKKSLTEIEQELDNYRKYIKDNKEELEKECIKDGEESLAISDFSGRQKLPTIIDITQKSLFLNRFVIDDPLQSASFKNLDIINSDRKLRGFAPITDHQAKEKLWDKIQYMKNLLPGVNANVEYIKFYPLSKEPTNELLNKINVPDLSFPNLYPEVYKWFNEKIVVKTIDDSQHLVDLIEPCKQLGISFESDSGFLLMPAFLYPTDNGRGKLEYQNVVPSQEMFTIWKEEEIIKSIRDRFLDLVRKNEFRIKFGAIVSTESTFENDFLKSSIITPPTTTAETRILQVLTKMQLPSLSSTSFEKIMGVRQFFDEAFEGFRKQLKDDIISMQQATDEKQLETFSKELEAKYESKIKEIEAQIKFKFNFSGFDYFPTGIDIATFLTTAEPTPMLLTGANILYKIYDGFVNQRREAKNNQCYFLYKLK